MNLFEGFGLVFLIGGLMIYGITGFVLFLGMHNNTKSGNSFDLMNPFIIFLPSEFNAKGNQYRKKMLWYELFSLVLAGIYFFYVR